MPRYRLNTKSEQIVIEIIILRPQYTPSKHNLLREKFSALLIRYRKMQEKILDWLE